MLNGYKGNIYFALATEQSSYTACRYDNNTCSSQYEDVIDQTTEEYFPKLKANLLSAININQIKFTKSLLWNEFRWVVSHI
jgi:hypothetical protein